MANSQDVRSADDILLVSLPFSLGQRSQANEGTRLWVLVAG